MDQNTTPLKKILLLTPVYPADDVHKSTTPVVHFFTKVWVKMGYDVIVMHYPVNFPSIVYSLAKPFVAQIGSEMGSEIRTWALNERDYVIDGVKVKRLPMVKMIPHGRYSKQQIKKAVESTIGYCSSINFKPDIIISHWANPSYEIMHYLKAAYQVPTCYVAHNTGNDLMTIYNKEAKKFVSETDLFGFRSGYIKRCFESYFDCSDKAHFLCNSGIPDEYVEKVHRDIVCVRNFIFVGTLIKRKYPAQIVSAVFKAFGEKEFLINYIGEGDEAKTVERVAGKLGIKDKVHLLGRMSRNEVVSQLDKNEVFIMISRNETFGLVYLEAMARGCITIASRREGFDGIIIDGENGFLCEAGNSDELSLLLNRIMYMSTNDLNRISENAIATARKMTDYKVAKDYIEKLDFCYKHYEPHK